MMGQSGESCTCTFVAPRRRGERATFGPGKYVTYLDYIEDDSVIDLACPFHGENGSMVMVIHATPLPADYVPPGGLR
jgi:hypothetical protein